MKAKFATVAEYFNSLSLKQRKTMTQLRAAIRSAVPKNATEVISYGIPAFKDKKVLVWYAAFTDHFSLFPTKAILNEFKHELKDYSTSKGTVHFPSDKPLPITLIKKMVKARVAMEKPTSKS